MLKSTFDRCFSNMGVVNTTSRTEFAMFVKIVDVTTGTSVVVCYTGIAQWEPTMPGLVVPSG